MPCYDARGTPEYKYEQRQFRVKNEKFNVPSKNLSLIYDDIVCQLQSLSENIEILEARNTLLAQLLCFVMNNINESPRNILTNVNSDLKKWWVEHEKFDNERSKNVSNI